MIPRPSVTTVHGGAPVSEAIEVMAASHSRLPVLGTDVDDVVGIASLRDLLAHTDRATPVREVARPAVMVPESLPLPAVLARLRDTDDQFACVVDEYGGLAGVITVEDIAEELVGEIADEHDTASSHPPVLHDGTWTLPGATHLDEVERLIGHDLPEGDYETVAGLVMAELQRLPDPGDTVEITLPKPAGTPRPTITVTVDEVTRRVPHTVSITLGEASR
jgi:CBS domain containing-hemolysin-like protein